MNKLLKFFYSKNKQFFAEQIVTDFFGEIPDIVKEQAITILAEQRTKVNKLLMYQAFMLQRRLVHNPKESEVIYGMLLQIKILKQLLGESDVREDHPVIGKTISVTEAREKGLAEAIEGVKKFKGRNRTA